MSGNNGMHGMFESGGNNIFNSPWTSPPAAPKVGDLWICPRSYYDYFQWDGKTWVGYVDSIPLSPPSLNPFLSGSFSRTVPYAYTGGTYVRDKRVVGAGWYCVTAFRARADFSQYANMGGIYGCQADLYAHNLYVTAWQDNSGRGQTLSTKCTGINGWNSTYGVYDSYGYYNAASLIWLKMYDNGTNRYCQVSPDGANWYTVHSVGRTDWCTITEFGFLGTGKFLHWEVGKL